MARRLHINRDNINRCYLTERSAFFSVEADGLPEEFDLEKAFDIEVKSYEIRKYLEAAYNLLRGGAKVSADGLEIPECVRVEPKAEPPAPTPDVSVSEAISSGELPTG